MACTVEGFARILPCGFDENIGATRVILDVFCDIVDYSGGNGLAACARNPAVYAKIGLDVPWPWITIQQSLPSL